MSSFSSHRETEAELDRKFVATTFFEFTVEREIVARALAEP